MEDFRRSLVVLAVLLPMVGVAAEDALGQGRRGGGRGGGFRADRGDFGRGGRPDFNRGGPGGDRPDFRRGDRPDFGRGGPGGPFGRGGDFGPGGGPFGGGRGIGPGTAEARMGRMEFFLSRADANGDGVIGPDELQGPMGGMLKGMADRAGLDPGKPIPVAKLRAALEERFRRPQDGSATDQPSGDKEGDKKPDAAEDEEPLVPGFGVDRQLQPVPPFGVRLGSVFSGGSGSLSGGGSGSSSSSDRRGSKDKDQWRRMAKEIVKRNDEDQSGALEKDEWDRMRISPGPADRNNDGVVTVEELAARLADDRNDRVGRSGSGGFGSSSRSNYSQGKSYRPRSPIERLPEGLPDWFIRCDTSGDGQVSMDEYASSWTESKAQEFVALDLNNDGFITPREGLKAAGQEAEAEPGGDKLAREPQTGGGFWFP